MRYIACILFLSGVTAYGGSTPAFTASTLNFSGTPNSVALGSDGNIWLIDRAANNVGRLTADGTYTTFAIPTANAIASGIAAGPDGNAWFAEFGPTPNKIARVTPDGVITEFSMPAGKNLGSITAGDDGNVWFTESTSSSSGPPSYFLGHISTADGSIGDFALPTNGRAQGLTSGVDGNLWIGWVESSGSKYDILRVTQAGKVTSFALPNGPLNALGATMLLGPDGNIWLTFQNNLARVKPDGTVTMYAIPTANANMLPAGLTIGNDSNIWFTEFSSGKIGQLVVDSATDGGQATINESDSLGGLPQALFPLPSAPRTAAKTGTLGDGDCSDVYAVQIQESTTKPPTLKVLKKPPTTVCADVAVHMTREKDPNKAKPQLRVTVTNNGPATATNVQMKLWIFFVDNGGLTPTSFTQSWPAISKGQHEVYVLDSEDTDQIFDAVVHATEVDPQPKNNRHRADRHVGRASLRTLDVKLEDPIAAPVR